MLSKYVHVLSIKISLPPLFTPPIIHSKLVEILYKVFFYCREQLDLTHTDSPRGPSLVGTRVFFCSRDWTLSTSPTSMAFSSFSSFLFHSDSWKY